MAATKSNGNGGVALTMKEAVIEIRDDVKALRATVDSKADKAELAVVEARAVAAAQLKAHETVIAAQEKQEDQRKADRRWIMPMVLTVLATLVIGVVNIGLRLLHVGY
jgi:hypothetical protein